MRWCPGRIHIGFALPFVLAARAALAAQGPGVSEGNAEPITQATAAALALFPPVAVAVFALARLIRR